MKYSILTKCFALVAFIAIMACEKQEAEIEPEESGDWLEYYDYIPFPESNAMWTNVFYSRTWWDNTTNYGKEVKNKYFFNGDTSINGKKYLKLYNDITSKRIVYDTTTTTSVVDSGIVYSGAFRQSISEKKVYFLFKDEFQEKKLYDFSAKLGESISFFTNKDVEGTVYCIDSLLINERYHKIYYVQVGNILNAVTYIEGIGNVSGVILDKITSIGDSHFQFISFEYNSQKHEINWTSATSCFD